MSEQPRRRHLIGAAAMAGAALLTGGAADLPSPEVPAGLWSASYWATKHRDGEAIRLAVYRKRASAPAPGGAALPVLLLVHGSSPAALARPPKPTERTAGSSSTACAPARAASSAGFPSFRRSNEAFTAVRPKGQVAIATAVLSALTWAVWAVGQWQATEEVSPVQQIQDTCDVTPNGPAYSYSSVQGSPISCINGAAPRWSTLAG